MEAQMPALVEMLVARQLWIALYNGREIYEGFSLDQTLTYMVLSMVIYNLLKGDGVQYIHWKIRSGNVLFDLIYPLRFPISLMVFGLSSLIITILTIAIPLLLMTVFLLKIPLPASLTAWLAFAVSFLLGCVIFSWIDILASLLTFVFPFGFMAYYPAHHFFQLAPRNFPTYFPYLSPLVAVIRVLIALGFWSLGLKHYQSTGT